MYKSAKHAHNSASNLFIWLMMTGTGECKWSSSLRCGCHVLFLARNERTEEGGGGGRRRWAEVPSYYMYSLLKISHNCGLACAHVARRAHSAWILRGFKTSTWNIFLHLLTLSIYLSLRRMIRRHRPLRWCEPDGLLRPESKPKHLLSYTIHIVYTHQTRFGEHFSSHQASQQEQFSTKCV